MGAVKDMWKFSEIISRVIMNVGRLKRTVG
jgi:hypothetical protein